MDRDKRQVPFPEVDLGPERGIRTTRAASYAIHAQLITGSASRPVGRQYQNQGTKQLMTTAESTRVRSCTTMPHLLRSRTRRTPIERDFVSFTTTENNEGDGRQQSESTTNSLDKYCYIISEHATDGILNQPGILKSSQGTPEEPAERAALWALPVPISPQTTVLADTPPCSEEVNQSPDIAGPSAALWDPCRIPLAGLCTVLEFRAMVERCPNRTSWGTNSRYAVSVTCKA